MPHWLALIPRNNKPAANDEYNMKNKAGYFFFSSFVSDIINIFLYNKDLQKDYYGTIIMIMII